VKNAISGLHDPGIGVGEMRCAFATRAGRRPTRNLSATAWTLVPSSTGDPTRYRGWLWLLIQRRGTRAFTQLTQRLCYTLLVPTEGDLALSPPRTEAGSDGDTYLISAAHTSIRTAIPNTPHRLSPNS